VSDPQILDACCGGRHWWWDKEHPLAVYMDERTVLWLDAVLTIQRHQFRETGVCLRIAKDARVGFRVDSFINGLPGDWPGADTIETNWRQTAFTCPRNMALLHFHVIQPKDSTWLMEHGHTEYLPTNQVQCRVGGNDLHHYWSQFPFNAIQCGRGVDSIIAYRVRP